MSRLEDVNNNGNGEPTPMMVDFFHEKIFPVMCMASVEPLELKQEYFLNVGALPYLNQTFKLNLTVFKREELGPAHMTFVISSSNILIPPELFAMVFNDPEGEEAKEFLFRPIYKFLPFKKAILLFDKRPYLLTEFEETVMKWRESLKEIL